MAFALKSYAGTVIVVSHDRGFIKEIGTKILEVIHGSVRLYPGTYEEYIWKLQQEEVSEENIVHEPDEIIETPPKKKTERGEKKKQERELRLCEKKIEQCEEELSKKHLEVEKLNQSISEAKSPPLDKIKSLSETSLKIEELEALWLQLTEERERIKKL